MAHTKHTHSATCLLYTPKKYPVAYGGGGFGVFKPPPLEIPKALQNLAKLNPIVKTAKNC